MRPPLVGLTGAIGAGKSTVLAAFARHGCAVLDSDAVVHELYRRPELRDALVARLGPVVLAADGELDRAAIARAVFGDDERRAWLEGLVHPLVGRELERWAAEERQRRPPPRLLVHEVPLLFEAGLEGRYDRILVVRAPDAVRRERLAVRGKLEAAEAREARLMPEAEKVRRADDVLANDGDLDELERAVARYVARYGVAS